MHGWHKYYSGVSTILFLSTIEENPEITSMEEIVQVCSTIML